MQETSNLSRTPIQLQTNDLVPQIEASRLSKQGKKSVTGIFEGTPENAANARKTITVPNNSPQSALLYNQSLGNQKAASTYLDYLKQEKKI